MGEKASNPREGRLPSLLTRGIEPVCHGLDRKAILTYTEQRSARVRRNGKLSYKLRPEWQWSRLRAVPVVGQDHPPWWLELSNRRHRDVFRIIF
jgi:hypothetical protein